jgi:uncharacterized protein YceK
MMVLAIPCGLIVSSVGCATALNTQDASLCKPYGGVTMSLFEFSGGGEMADYSALILWPIWLIDKPFSLFADTLTLPYVWWVQQHSRTSPNSQTPQFSPTAP